MKLLNSIITVLTYIILLDKAAAQNFPFARETFDINGKIKRMTFDSAREYRDETIGNIIDKNVAEKDAAAQILKLAYPSPMVESKYFETNIDLTDHDGSVFIAIHVDDIANLTVTEINDAGNEIGTPIPFNITGSALWRSEQSYKEFPNPIPCGKKYKLKLDYTNTINLTEQYNGLIDYDGVNVFLINKPTVDVEILSAPDYLYAAAKHATPIEFKIKNVEKAMISSIEVEFHDGSSSYKYPINNRFVAENGPDQNNGSSNVYTCFVPSSFYSKCIVDNTFSKDAKFRVKVNFTDIVGDPSVNVERLSEWHRISGYFADAKMKHLVEIGAGETFLPLAPGDAYNGNGELLYEVLKSDLDEIPVKSTWDGKRFILAGFGIGGDEMFCVNLSSNTSFGAHAKLYDNEDIVGSSYSGQAYKARAYGLRKGGLVFVSYQGKAMNTGILQEGELAMDLSKRTTDLDCTLFDSKHSRPNPALSNYTTLVISERGDSLKSTLNLTSGVTGITACFLFANPVWAAALGTTAIIAGYVADRDADTINAAEVHIKQVRQVIRNDGTMPGPVIRNIFHEWVNSPTHTSVTSVADNTPLSVGDQYLLFVEINIACTAESYTFSSSHAEVKAKWESVSDPSDPTSDPVKDSNTVKVNARPR